MALTIQRAAPDERGVLENLLQLYIHDFSDFWRGQDRGELQPDGTFPPYEFLPQYFSEPDRTPLILRVGGHLAGFALINKIGHSGQPVDWNVAEFFVVRKHRGGGTGLEAARQIISSRPGVWEIAVAAVNKPALAFWPRMIAAVPARDLQTLSGDGDHWTGLIYRFSV